MKIRLKPQVIEVPDDVGKMMIAMNDRDHIIKTSVRLDNKPDWSYDATFPLEYEEVTFNAK